MADHEARALPAQGEPLSRRRLSRSFYERPAVVVAPGLLGRTLVRRLSDGTRLAGRIVETEAYEPGDPASHGFHGMTARNAVMFGASGHLYVFFTYGHHHMLNAVTRGEGEGSAVLLRAIEPLEGLESMSTARGRALPVDLCSGPGKLTQALSVNRAHDGADLVGGDEIWLEAGSPAAPGDVGTSVRVGISAGLEHRWRFFISGDPFVSRGRPGPVSGPMTRSSTVPVGRSPKAPRPPATR
ncbi:MAG: DNA-3-methyladenine glycosylase [Actinomycetota bacterium]